MKKRAYKIFSVCAVFSILLSSLCVFTSAVSGQAYSNPYMPVCSDYPTSSQLPYGEDLTEVVCLKKVVGNNTRYDWFFVSGSYTNFDGASSYEIENSLSFIVSESSNQGFCLVTFYSHSIIKQVTQVVSPNGVTTTSRSNYSTFQSNASSYVANIEVPYDSTSQIISTCGYLWIGYPVDVAIGKGLLSGVTLITPYYIASYPDNVQHAINSIQDNSSLLTQYYTSINGKLNSLSSDHVALYNQNNELQSQVSELQSQINSQSGEYQSALDQAQSEIQSNANAAASQAADDVNNAGEDMSDIDDDVSDVNSIVDTLDEWISQLDDYSDTIDEAASDVADSMEQGKSLISGFLGICPPIVIALFAFALVFIVVRKVIGR